MPGTALHSPGAHGRAQHKGETLGFDLYASTGVITFANTRFKGAEVTVRLDMPLADFEAHDAIEDEAGRLKWFVEHALVSWNIEVKGQPVPVTPEAYLALPRQFTARVHREWMRLVNDPDIPLAPPSSDGDTSATD